MFKSLPREQKIWQSGILAGIGFLSSGQVAYYGFPTIASVILVIANIFGFYYLVAGFDELVRDETSVTSGDSR